MQLLSLRRNIIPIKTLTSNHFKKKTQALKIKNSFKKMRIPNKARNWNHVLMMSGVLNLIVLCNTNHLLNASSKRKINASRINAPTCTLDQLTFSWVKLVVLKTLIAQVSGTDHVNLFTDSPTFATLVKRFPLENAEENLSVT